MYSILQFKFSVLNKCHVKLSVVLKQPNFPSIYHVLTQKSMLNKWVILSYLNKKKIDQTVETLAIDSVFCLFFQNLIRFFDIEI